MVDSIELRKDAYVMISIDLSEKTALVTGATGQLGRVMARTLAEAGADIILHYHQNKKQAFQLADEICRIGVRCMTVQADVGDLDSVLAMRDKIAITSFSRWTCLPRIKAFIKISSPYTG